jgi:hypothetical protein
MYLCNFLEKVVAIILWRVKNRLSIDGRGDSFACPRLLGELEGANANDLSISSFSELRMAYVAVARDRH